MLMYTFSTVMFAVQFSDTDTEHHVEYAQLTRRLITLYNATTAGIFTFNCFIVGIDRFYDNLEMMFGFRINPFMKFCWVFASPLFCVVRVPLHPKRALI